MQQDIIDAYSQTGGDLSYFVGRQYGSGWLQSIGRFAFPILKKVFKVAGNTAEDVIVNEKPLLDSLRDNTIKEVMNPTSTKTINRSVKRRAPSSIRNNTQPPLFQKKRRR